MTFLGRAERTKGEAGFALITVMLSMMALMGLSIAIVEYGIGSQFLSNDATRTGMPRSPRLRPAWVTTSTASTASRTTRRSTAPARVRLRTRRTPRCRGSSRFPGSSSEKFRYWVDSAANQVSLVKSGSVSLTVTGKVGNAARTLQVSFRVATYLDFLYYTDLEISDPLIASNQGGAVRGATPRVHPGCGHGLRPDGIELEWMFADLLLRHVDAPGRDQRPAPHERPAPRVRDTPVQRRGHDELPGVPADERHSGETRRRSLARAARAVRTTRASSRTATRPTSTTATRSRRCRATAR